MLIHLREAEISNGLRAQCGECLRAADFSGAKLVKQLGGFGGGHAAIMLGYRIFSSKNASTSLMGIRVCSIVSRSRRVTVFFSSSPLSPRVSKSMVTP